MKKLVFVFILALMTGVAIAQQTCESGVRLLENENYKGALDQFTAVAKSDPRNSSIYYWIGEVSYRQDDPVEAEKAYKKGLSINPQCAECKVGLGKITLDQGKAAEANEFFESAARLDKKNPAIFAMIGDSYLMSKHPDADKAIQYLTTARDMDTKVAKYWAHLGDAFKLKGDNGEAMTNFETAVEKDPNNTAAYISMARIWGAAKQYDLAIEKLMEAIRLSPDDAPPYKDLIELYIQTGQYDKVTPLLEKYTSLTGDDIDAKVRLVKFLTFQAKDYDRAIQEGEKVLKTNPEQYTLHRWLAWSYYEKGMFKESFDHSNMLFDEIAKQADRKTFASDYDYWAKAAFKLGDIDEAAHIYRKYLEFEPSKANEIYGQLAKAYYDKKNYEQGIAYYKRKAETKPLTAGDNLYLGLSYYFTKQDTLADSVFVEILNVTPNYASGYLYRAKIADRIDTTDPKLFLAAPHYTNYIKYVNEDVASGKITLTDAYKKNLHDAYYYLGVYHAQTDSLDLAFDDFTNAIAMDSTDQYSKENIGILKDRGVKGTGINKGGRKP